MYYKAYSKTISLHCIYQNALTRKLSCTKAEFAPQSKDVSQVLNVQHWWLLSEVAIKDVKPFGLKMRIYLAISSPLRSHFCISEFPGFVLSSSRSSIFKFTCFLLSWSY